VRSILTSLLTLFALAGCSAESSQLTLLERPPTFTGCEYRAVPDGHWCLNDECYMREVQHNIMLNDTIDKYENMISEHLESTS
jgi:hypothetical protein